MSYKKYEKRVPKQRKGQCKKCKEKFIHPGDDFLNVKYVKNGHCFKCYHWRNILTKPDKHIESVRLENGQHWQYNSSEPFVTDPESNEISYRIEYLDGRVVYTNKMWCNGVMTPYWVKKYPANAKSIQEQ